MHYVIGDVHGCFDEMTAMIRKIEKSDPDAVFYFVGDFIDRGPKVWETLTWAMEHVCPGGKYQSVLGNHEQMVLDWYTEKFLPWARNKGSGKHNLPRTHYDFSDTVAVKHNLLTKERLSPVMDFFKSLSLSIPVKVKGIPYRIVHAAYDTAWGERELRERCIWDRPIYGNPGPEVVIHGHTPTVSADYIFGAAAFREEKYAIRPGKVCYKENDINIDGGCVFGQGFEIPAFLCAICLETLEEIYLRDVKAQLLRQNPGLTPDEVKRLEKRYQKLYSQKDIHREAILARLQNNS